jgi:hypothetical protein
MHEHQRQFPESRFAQAPLRGGPILQRCQFNQPHAVVQTTDELEANLECQAGFAAAASARQSDQSALGSSTSWRTAATSSARPINPLPRRSSLLGLTYV